VGAHATPPRRRGHATILDVARAAGVSKSTVSNVIRDTGSVSPETRRRVRAAIEQVGYRPNAVARSLVRRRTSTVGLVVGDLANVFYSELAKLVEQRMSAAGYTAMICNTDGHPASERRRIGSLLEQRVAGIVMLQFSGAEEVLAEVRGQGVPLVVVSGWEPGSDCVAVDDTAGVELGVRHLLGLGHRRVAYLSSGLVEPSADTARTAGYRRGLREAGIEPDRRLMLRWEHPAYLRADEALRRHVAALLGSQAPPTAFSVSNDLVAVDLIETLEGLGVRVPDDVSVVGFDDIAIAGLSRVSLTTVAHPRETLAEVGTRILIERIEGTDGPPRRVQLEPSLVVRGSTAPAPPVPPRASRLG
jgi:LacI family transcriptional regulator